MQCRLFGIPDFFQIGVLTLDTGDHIGQFRQAFFRGSIGLFLERLTLDFQLNQTTFETIQGLGLRIHFHPDLGSGLVHQVNGLVRQLTVGNVTMRQFGGGDNGAICHLNPVVNFITLFQAPQDGDGIFLTGFADQYFLEATLKSGVFFDVFTVFVQGSRAHAVQLATSERRLEHITGIHGAFGLAGTNHGVNLVDEQDDLTFLFGQFVQNSFQAFFKLTPELGAGNKGTHIE